MPTDAVTGATSYGIEAREYRFIPGYDFDAASYEVATRAGGPAFLRGPLLQTGHSAARSGARAVRLRDQRRGSAADVCLGVRPTPPAQDARNPSPTEQASCASSGRSW
jgi:hypothetical protein